MTGNRKVKASQRLIRENSFRIQANDGQCLVSNVRDLNVIVDGVNAQSPK